MSHTAAPYQASSAPNKVLANKEFKTDPSSEFWENWLKFAISVSPVGPEATAGSLVLKGGWKAPGRRRGGSCRWKNHGFTKHG